MKYIDKFLNGITMYKLVLYGLTLLSLLSIVFGFLGLVAYSGLSLFVSLFTLLFVCFATNEIFSKIFKVQTNIESSWITAYILFFVVFPVESMSDFWIVALVGFLAMASKYILTINKKHVFNPVAISVFIVGLLGFSSQAWWVGTLPMLFPVSILGFLVLRKLKKFQMFFVFALTSLAALSWSNLSSFYGVVSVIEAAIISAPIIFFGTVMLTEPLTTPPTKKFQLIYAFLVGLLYGSHFSFGILIATPAFALVVGNIFSYIVSPRARLLITLSKKNQLSKDIYEFVFDSDDKLDFKPGQYLEWSLGHKNPDQRGNRRYFTIASSPTEKEIMLGVKFYEPSSSFKNKLLSMEVGEKLIASQLSGEFTLPDDKNKKLVFIAGGIGVTPFRSMVKNMLDTNETRDAVLFFSNRTPEDIVYKDIFDEAKRVGLKTIYAVNDLAGATPNPSMPVGFVDEKMIRENVPDFADRVFYISGPHGMITAFEATLSKMGVSRSNIKTDFFPGFV